MPGEMLVDFEVHMGVSPHHDAATTVKMDIRRVNFWYGAKQALIDVTLKLYRREVTAFIGPSGCGKTTLLRCLNRSNEIIPGTRMEGTFCSTAKISTCPM
jgi:phosphate transport system ATP-binding protein